MDKTLEELREAHAATTQKLSEANQKVNELTEEIEGFKSGWGGVSDMMSEKDNLQSQLDSANKEIERLKNGRN